MTLIVSSHILSELEQYADRLLILNEGRIVPHEAGAGNASHTTIAIRCVAQTEEAAAILENISGVSSIHSGEDGITAIVEGGPEECMRVLREAMGKGGKIYEYRVA